MINFLSSIEPKFSKIDIYYEISTQDLEWISWLFSSSKTKFWLLSINLTFHLLSELLAILFMCAECPELESIEFSFLISDVSNKQDEIYSAVKNSGGNSE